MGTMYISVFLSSKMPKMKPMEYYKNSQVYDRCTFLVCMSRNFSQRGISETRKISPLRYQSVWTSGKSEKSEFRLLGWGQWLIKAVFKACFRKETLLWWCYGFSVFISY